jgi:subtilisin family serine protease
MRVNRADELPRRTYRVAGSVSELLGDLAAVGELARAVCGALRRDLRDFEIRDASKVREYHSTLAVAAALVGELDDALAHSARAAELNENPAARAASGYQLRAIVEASRAAPAERAKVYEGALRRELSTIPLGLARAELTAHRAALELQSGNIVHARAEQQLDPTVQDGRIPGDSAVAALGLAYVLHAVLPHREATIRILSEVLRDGPPLAHERDIWRERELDLEDSTGLSPVAVGIWDSGVDARLFPGRVSVDDSPGREPGLAWTWRGEPVRGLLRPLEISPADLASAQRDIRGFTELQAGLETPEARALRGRISLLSKEEAKRFAEATSFLMNYAHGTHVAGIALAGNPAARLVIVRSDQPWRLTLPPPDDTWADAQVHMIRASVRFLVDAGARVVNMSWNFSPGELERRLVRYGVGTPELRQRSARRSFDAIAAAMEEALRGAPDVLFVAAAGNGNSDTAFHELVPSSFDLPNTITAGAVDAAGNVAAFTSHGKVDVYANGVHVESVIPGGARQAWSGTSMAAPQVSNLAAKLVAVYPALGVAELKRLIIDGAELRSGPTSPLRLLHPRRSMALARTEADGHR